MKTFLLLVNLLPKIEYQTQNLSISGGNIIHEIRIIVAEEQ
jgi:hypothetical protein